MRGQDLWGLSFDPAPGDAESVRGVAADLRITSRRVGAAAADLSLATGQLWSGAAARSFQTAARQLLPDATAAADSLIAAATALEEYADVLSGAAARASALDLEARQSWERAAQARAAGSEPGPADEALLRARRSARALAGVVQEAAERAAARVRRAAQYAPAEPGLMQRVGVAAVEALNAANDMVGDWVVEHAGTISLLSDILGNVSSACGLLAFIPVVGTGFGAVALATGAAATAGHALLAAYAGGSKWTVATDVTGLATGGASRLLSSKVAKESVASNGARANGTTLSWFSPGYVMGDREAMLRVRHYWVDAASLTTAAATATRPRPASSVRGTGPLGVDWSRLSDPSPGPVPQRPAPATAPSLTDRIGSTGRSESSPR